jgi:hypothetical protein
LSGRHSAKSAARPRDNRRFVAQSYCPYCLTARPVLFQSSTSSNEAAPMLPARSISAVVSRIRSVLHRLVFLSAFAEG